MVKGVFHILAGGCCEAGASHADHIEPVNLVGAGDEDVGGHILADAGEATNHTEAADLDELVKG